MSEAIRNATAVRTDDPDLVTLDAANQVVRAPVAQLKNVTISVINTVPGTTFTLFVRYTVQERPDEDPSVSLPYFVKVGADITEGDTFPVERTLSDSNGMPLAARYVEVELDAESGSPEFEVLISGQARAGVS